jgi:putative cofactor-binding repeat protein
MSGRQRVAFMFGLAACANGNPLLAADWCVSTGAQLSQALLGAGSNGEADVIRLQTGTYRSTQAAGFSANLAGHALELSGGWASGCLFRQRGAHSTIDGEYERPAMRISGSIPQPRTVRVAHLAFIRGVDDEVGGLAISSTGAGNLNVEIEDCRFHDNTQTDIEDVIGGGLYVNADEVSVLGNVFTDNHAGNLGGAGAITCFGSLGAFTNNTVVRNTARFGQADVRGGMMLTGNCLWEVANNILWDNEGYDLQIGDGEATLRNNNLDDLVGTPMASSGNVNIDPQFVSIGILRLQRSSPMIDAGLNETLLGLPQYSFDGGIRIAGPRIDIGAYELDVLFADDFDPLFGVVDQDDAP